ncbi:MAG: hypothetical protein EXR98_21040 [Gemmataceae bacterium]|nr:hypothetical protein [Gemmataceae bacterium]
MAAQKQEEKHPDHDKPVHPQMNGIVGEQVMHQLGQPSGLLRVQVRKLWEDRYRVNIFVGVDAACATVAHSYFLVVDGEGKIVASTPKITRKY